MKIVQKILFGLLVLLFFTNCKKNDQRNESVLLSVNERAHASAEWEKFKNTSEVAIIGTQNRINLLWAKNNSATAKNQVKIRRIVNKTQYKLEKLQKKLYDHNKWFINHIGTYTQENAAETKLFEMTFKKKLDAINIEIDNCKC